MSTFDPFLKYLENSTGRDKFGKTVQYASRLLMWYLLKHDPKSEMGLRFKGLFETTRDARKLTRYFKTLNEVKAIETVFASPDKDSANNVLTLLSKIGMANYWFWDNLVYLKKAKFLKSDVDFNYYANLGWTVGLVFSILLALKKIKDNIDEETKIQSNIESSTTTTDVANKQLAKLRNQRLKLVLNMVANLGDLTVASNGIQLPQKLIGQGFSDGVMGIGGLLSALITGYYLWLDINGPKAS